MKKQNKDWGKFETMYRGLYPDLSEEDREILNQYPEHREFVFEQFMKTEGNTLPKHMTVDQMYNNNPKVDNMVWLVTLVAFGIMLLVTFIPRG